MKDPTAGSTFGATRRLDYELEMVCVALAIASVLLLL